MKKLMMLILLFISTIAFTHPVSAHADLASSTPAEGSILDIPPSEIVLTFSSVIDDHVFEFDVVNANGESFVSGNAVLNPERTELSAKMKPGTVGNLTVKYSVISKDGHPIEGVVNFVVNPPAIEETEIDFTEFPILDDTAANPPNSEEIKPGIPSSSKEADLNTPAVDSLSSQNMATPLSSIIKSLYLISLLLLTGSLLWSFCGVRMRYLAQMQLVHLGLLVLFTWSQARNFLLVFDHIPWEDLFLRTEVGQYWTGALVVTVLGLYILGKNRYVNIVWVAAILLLKSFNSHAIASKLPTVTVGLNLVHLVFAGLWIAGLFLLVTSWKSAETKSFIPRFSKTALISILVLSVTGTLYALILSPTITALWTTTWGYWLIAKIVAVLGVFIVGSLIRRDMKSKGTFANKVLVLFDMGLAITILLIVGVLTQLSSSM